MLKLPDVTLVCVETLEHQLMRMAIEHAVRQIEFAEVLVFTDRPLEFSSLTKVCSNHRAVSVPNWPTKLDWCRFNWFGVPPHVRTSHALFMQWDAGVWDVGMWRDGYLDYDFIGAPWWHKDGKNVGNSGFGLKSSRLMRYIYNHGDFYPCDTDIEDDLLCRKYRPVLEETMGFMWAPERIARDFAYEGCDQQPPNKHFGFHACQNFCHVFDHDQLIERAKLMIESPYIRDSYMMKNFVQTNPEIIKEIAASGDVGELRAAE